MVSSMQTIIGLVTICMADPQSFPAAGKYTTSKYLEHVPILGTTKILRLQLEIYYRTSTNNGPGSARRALRCPQMIFAGTKG